jgi:hypothetical protein
VELKDSLSRRPRLGRRDRQCDKLREILTEMQAACDRCHRRKSRCNKVKPRCGFCAKSNSECFYSDRSRDPSIRREHVQGIERRLRQEEAKNQALISEIARLKSLAASRDREDSDTPQDVIQVRVLNLDNITQSCPAIPAVTCHSHPELTLEYVQRVASVSLNYLVLSDHGRD